MKKVLNKITSITTILITISTLAFAQNPEPAPQTQQPVSAPSGIATGTKPVVQKPAAKKPVYKPAPAKQSPEQLPASNDHSLNGQYQDLLKHSWTQQGYKVINPARLSALWKNALDTVRAERNRYPVLQRKIDEQSKTIEDLKAQVAVEKENFEKSTSSVNEVSLLGMSVDKSTYNTIMWGAVLTLAAALLIVLFTAGKSIREAKYRRQLFDEVSAEYQTYKIKANEKEKKLARELQTERNRVEELLDKNK